MTTEQITKQLAQVPAQVIQQDRNRYLDQIRKTAKVIADRAEIHPVVLLAGPSGSGKTTTALLIERELEDMGLQTHVLSMDNYFNPLSHEEKQLLRQNRLDLERPDRVDIPFFQEQLGQLLRGEEVQLPRYDFLESKRVFDGCGLRRKPNEIVIMEGIHALNPEVTGYTEQTTRVYVSVRTRIAAKDGTTLHPSKIRLVRRMIRDRLGRGRALTETIGMRDKVDAGEQKYIMPFKKYAHCNIDSFYECEMSVYRPFLFEETAALAEKMPDLEDLVHIWRELPNVDEGLLPKDSLLREFIGGSVLNY